MIRPTRSLLVALVAVPLSSAACTTDFDRFLGSGGGGTGGSTTQTTSVGGAGGTGQGGGGGADPCDGVDCNDNEPCTEDFCSDGVCSHPADATPMLVQVPGDCQILACQGTPSASVSNDDDTDAPGSDGNECTQDICSAGAPYPYEPSGTVCNTTGFCDATGSCSACNVPADCGSNTSCGTRTCAGTPPACGWSYATAGMVVGSDGTTGNCMSQVCNGTSENFVIGINNNDTPADVNNDCRAPSCTAGVPGQANIDNTDLPLNVANDCRSPSCTAGVPGQATVNNADTPVQTSGDCKTATCTAGNPSSMNANDPPADIAMDCLDPTCTAGTPTTTPDDSETCDDTGIGTAQQGGQCLAGTCRDCTSTAGCNVGNSCSSNVCCTPMSAAVACAAAGAACGMVSDGCGGMVSCTDTCAASPQGDGCISNQCGCVDGNDCLGAGADGEDCTGNVCRCNNNNDCDFSDRGEECPSAPSDGACGCAPAQTASADCDVSNRGHACLAGLVCGCTVNTDCTGIGGGICNVGTGICS